jgi:hypothetical protein
MQFVNKKKGAFGAFSSLIINAVFCDAEDGFAIYLQRCGSIKLDGYLLA